MVELAALPLAHGGLHLIYHVLVFLEHSHVVLPTWMWFLGGVGVAAYLIAQSKPKS
jgi:hypothetical protein